MSYLTCAIWVWAILCFHYFSGLLRICTYFTFSTFPVRQLGLHVFLVAILLDSAVMCISCTQQHKGVSCGTFQLSSELQTLPELDALNLLFADKCQASSGEGSRAPSQKPSCLSRGAASGLLWSRVNLATVAQCSSLWWKQIGISYKSDSRVELPHLRYPVLIQSLFLGT